MSGSRIVLRAAAAITLLSGTAVLLQSGSAPGTTCSGSGSISSNFNGTRIDAGNYIWFNANFSASGIPATGATLYFSGGTVTFKADQVYQLGVPNAQITFSPTVSCATTVFDSGSNTFFTTVPVTGSDEIFLTGLAFEVPNSFAAAGGKVSGPVMWQGTWGANAKNVSVGWKWGAAVYSTFTTDYSALNILPAHGNSCIPGGGDHAGTPEGVGPNGVPYRNYVVGGARGGGGSNWTGSWSSTQNVSIANCH